MWVCTCREKKFPFCSCRAVQGCPREGHRLPVCSPDWWLSTGSVHWPFLSLVRRLIARSRAFQLDTQAWCTLLWAQTLLGFGSRAFVVWMTAYQRVTNCCRQSAKMNGRRVRALRWCRLLRNRVPTALFCACSLQLIWSSFAVHSAPCRLTIKAAPSSASGEETPICAPLNSSVGLIHGTLRLHPMAFLCSLHWEHICCPIGGYREPSGWNIKRDSSLTEMQISADGRD